MIPSGWRVPDAPLRTSVLSAAVLGCLSVAVLARVTQEWLRLGPLYPTKATVLFAAVMVLVVGFVSPHHPHPRFGPANLVTTVRAVLVTLIVGLLGERSLPLTAAVASAASIVAAGLDGVDGWLARRTRMASAFGARFDMETDAVLVMALSALVWQHDKAGAWILLSGLMRYMFVAAGWVLPWLTRPLHPTLRGRAICVLQMAGLSLALVPGVNPPTSSIVSAVALAALVWSFWVDVRWLWRHKTT